MGGAINISGIELYSDILDRYSGLPVHYITNNNTVYYPQFPINIPTQSKTFNYQENYGVSIFLNEGVSAETSHWSSSDSSIHISINIIADEYNENLVECIDSYWSLGTNNQAVRDLDIISAALSSSGLVFYLNVNTVWSHATLAEYPDLSFTANAEYNIIFAYDSVQYKLIWDAHFTTDFNY